MIVHLRKAEGLVILFIRAEEGGAIADARIDVRPGYPPAFGRTDEEWQALPDGPYEVR